MTRCILVLYSTPYLYKIRKKVAGRLQIQEKKCGLLLGTHLILLRLDRLDNSENPRVHSSILCLGISKNTLNKRVS